MTDQKDTTVSTERLEELIASYEAKGDSIGLEFNGHELELTSALTELLSRRSTDGEAVAWRYSSGWVTGPDMVKLWLHTGDAALAGRKASSGNYVQPLYTHPIPIEPVAVSDEMVERFKASFIAETGSTMWPTDGQFRSILTAALQVKP